MQKLHFSKRKPKLAHNFVVRLCSKFKLIKSVQVNVPNDAY